MPTRPSPSQRPRIVITLTGGGYLNEAKALIRHMSDRFELHYLTTYDATSAPLDDIPAGPLHVVQQVTTLAESGILQISGNTLKCLAGAFVILRRIDPIAVICVGSSIAVPLCICARLLNKKTVFIESFTRVSRPSKTG